MTTKDIFDSLKYQEGGDHYSKNEGTTCILYK